MRRIRRNDNSVVEDGSGIGRGRHLIGGIIGIEIEIGIIEMVDGEREMGMVEGDMMIPASCILLQ